MYLEHHLKFWSMSSSAAKKPSVAAIDGLALGGGLELAMVPFTRHFFFRIGLLCWSQLLNFKFDLSRPVMLGYRHQLRS